jgi:hypothetical protein
LIVNAFNDAPDDLRKPGPSQLALGQLLDEVLSRVRRGIAMGLR